MMRTASGAQRSGAAVRADDAARQRDYLRTPRQYFASSFFVLRTPARWLRKRLWAARWPGRFAGSAVPDGSGGRTANALINGGSVVLFYSPSRDACACAAARAYVRDHQNHRTTEPQNENGRNQPFLRASAVLWRFCGSGSHILMGEYWSASSSCAASLDQALDAGTSGAKFRAPARLAAGAGGPIGGGVAGPERVAGNGGFLRFFGSPIGRVGMLASERGGNVVSKQALACRLHQPAGLKASAAGRLATPPGVDRIRRGGTPPRRASSVLRSLAQPIFQVSADFRIRCLSGVDVDRDGRFSWGSRKGSGERRLRSAASSRRAKAPGRREQKRVGVQGVFLVSGRCRNAATLWGGHTRVN